MGLIKLIRQRKEEKRREEERQEKEEKQREKERRRQAEEEERLTEDDTEKWEKVNRQIEERQIEEIRKRKEEESLREEEKRPREEERRLIEERQHAEKIRKWLEEEKRKEEEERPKREAERRQRQEEEKRRIEEKKKQIKQEMEPFLASHGTAETDVDGLLDYIGKKMPACFDRDTHWSMQPDRISFWYSWGVCGFFDEDYGEEEEDWTLTFVGNIADGYPIQNENLNDMRKYKQFISQGKCDEFYVENPFGLKGVYKVSYSCDGGWSTACSC